MVATPLPDINLFSLSPHLMVVAEVDYGEYLC